MPTLTPSPDDQDDGPYGLVRYALARAAGCATPVARFGFSLLLPYARQWGVLAFRSDGGRTCLTAGPAQDGRVGRMMRDGGFRAPRAQEAPANCGDFVQNFRELGGIVLVHSSLTDGVSSELTTVVYGLAAPQTASVSVRLGDGSRQQVAVTPVDGIAGATGAFIAPLPGRSVDGIVVEFTGRDGSRTELPF